MLDICGLHRIQRALIGCLVLALGIGGCASMPSLPAPAERPPLSGMGEEQRQIPTNDIYPWTRRCPARERVR